MESLEEPIPTTRPDRKSRKSVSFTTETELVDTDGAVTMAPANDDSKNTAESHAPTTPPLTEALNSFSDSKAQASEDGENGETAPAPAGDDVAPADDAGIDLTLKKKKKKKKVEIEGADDGADAAPAGEDGGLDMSLMKKKKKKKAPTGDDDFVAKLKALEVDGGEEGAAAAGEDEGDMLEGTGIWARDESRSIPYDLLLNRFFYLLSQKNPDHALGGTKSKIPPPQCLREGNKKTIFANIAEICKRMKRSEEHMTAYLFAEMGTSGSVDGSRRLVIKGKFQQKQIENLLRKYIIEYVTCKTCKSGDTELSKGENRLYFITCNSCGSRRSVTTIKTGFSAQVGRRKKQG